MFTVTFVHEIGKKEGIIEQTIRIKTEEYSDALRRFENAKSFAEGTNNGVIEDWMLWKGWEENVGCENCSTNGKKAQCWGEIGCHGYYSGCGCRECSEQDERNKKEE